MRLTRRLWCVAVETQVVVRTSKVMYVFCKQLRFDPRCFLRMPVPNIALRRLIRLYLFHPSCYCLFFRCRKIIIGLFV